MPEPKQVIFGLAAMWLNTVADSVAHNLEDIINFFIKRNTNTNAESFNSKIKLFRTNQRDFVDTKFFYSDYKNFLLSPNLIDVIRKKSKK